LSHVTTTQKKNQKNRGLRGHDRMVVGFIPTYAISAYHNQCLSPLTLWIWISLKIGLLDATLCDQVCQSLAAGHWFSPGTLVSSINKTDCHNITEILLKVTSKTITPLHFARNSKPSLQPNYNAKIYFSPFFLQIVELICIYIHT
jgi:hypothetical protein